MMKTTRVLIVDDSPIFREVFRDLLEVDRDLQIVGEASTGKRRSSR
jgi:DNA-binding NarL/FixJ family response regulator